jgi:hypothetical protein
MVNRTNKELRAVGGVQKDDKVLLIDDGSKEAKLSKKFLRTILREVPHELIIHQVKSLDDLEDLPEADKVIIPWDADDEAVMVLQHVAEKKPLKHEGKIKLLKGLTEEEVSLSCNLLGFAHEATKVMQAHKLLNELEEKQPNSKRNLGKLFE